MRPSDFPVFGGQEFGNFLADSFMLLRVADDAAAAYGVAAGFELGFDQGQKSGSGFGEGECGGKASFREMKLTSQTMRSILCLR